MGLDSLVTRLFYVLINGWEDDVKKGAFESLNL